MVKLSAFHHAIVAVLVMLRRVRLLSFCLRPIKVDMTDLPFMILLNVNKIVCLSSCFQSHKQHL